MLQRRGSALPVNPSKRPTPPRHSGARGGGEAEARRGWSADPGSSPPHKPCSAPPWPLHGPTQRGRQAYARGEAWRAGPLSPPPSGRGRGPRKYKYTLSNSLREAFFADNPAPWQWPYHNSAAVASRLSHFISLNSPQYSQRSRRVGAHWRDLLPPRARQGTPRHASLSANSTCPKCRSLPPGRAGLGVVVVLAGARPRLRRGATPRLATAPRAPRARCQRAVCALGPPVAAPQRGGEN